MQGWLVVGSAVLYIAFLFAVASYGDRIARTGAWAGGRPSIYALSLAVYCTSWTFFGSVGLASRQGLDFLTIYIGAGLMIGAAYPLVLRIIRLAKANKITSVADFIASRYGKSQAVAVTVTLIALAGGVPYIALQLKAVSQTLVSVVGYMSEGAGQTAAPILADIALVVALALAVFSILFGTRHVDATEHQHGLILAIAAESLIKLVAFLLVGLFVTFYMFDGFGDLFRQAAAAGDILPVFTGGLDGGLWLTMILLSFCCVLLLPRQFHVTVVENNTEAEYRRAAWVFPLYLVAINLFVVPIAIAGMILFPEGTANADMYVMELPVAAGSDLVLGIAFIGGLSAATAMVIVASVSLSVMICNDLVTPILVRRSGEAQEFDALGPKLLLIRRVAIVGIMLLAYVYDRYAGSVAALASIGLLSFAAIAQLAPSFFGGLIWRRGTARGAIAGMSVGITVWAYTLLLPDLVDAGLVSSWIMQNGAFGIGLLQPERLFGLTFNPLTHGVFWSLTLNVAAYVVVSLLRAPEPVERLQATEFVPADLTPLPQGIRLSKTRVTVSDLERTVARYLSSERAKRHFEAYALERGTKLAANAEADVHLIRYAERVLASAIGAPSSRIVLSLLLERRNASSRGALKLLDEASAALQYNRDLLQTAIDHVRDGIGVFDRDLRLICWNRRFRGTLDLPPLYGQIGTSLGEILREAISKSDDGDRAPRDLEELADDRLRALLRGESFQIARPADSQVLELRSDTMPDGGRVLTVSDVTERVRTAKQLSQANETLERRVEERTGELTRLNEELETARLTAEKANIGKTQFLAAASHDILQPLNAARLYASSLSERNMLPEQRNLAHNLNHSLEAVEDILGALLDISRLDAGAMKPELSVFRLSELFQGLAVEFHPIAQEKDIDLRIVDTAVSVRSDRRLLRRILQNLVSNALKYTDAGRVLVGVRRKRNAVAIQVYDTGAGISDGDQKIIFREFQRLDNGARRARGLGLGLSIVERVARVLDIPLRFQSRLAAGSMFEIEVATAATVPGAGRPPIKRPVQHRLDGLHVLCIDNEDAILEGMAALLRGWGCKVKTARSLNDAKKVTQPPEIVPDILVVDYHLDDDGNGLDAARTLRWMLNGSLPAVLVTADRSPEVRERAESLGIAVLHKPVKPAALRAVLTRMSRLQAAE